MKKVLLGLLALSAVSFAATTETASVPVNVTATVQANGEAALIFTDKGGNTQLTSIELNHVGLIEGKEIGTNVDFKEFEVRRNKKDANEKYESITLIGLDKMDFTLSNSANGTYAGLELRHDDTAKTDKLYTDLTLNTSGVSTITNGGRITSLLKTSSNTVNTLAPASGTYKAAQTQTLTVIYNKATI